MINNLTSIRNMSTTVRIQICYSKDQITDDGLIRPIPATMGTTCAILANLLST